MSDSVCIVKQRLWHFWTVRGWLMLYWANNAYEAWENVQHKLFFSLENGIWNLLRGAELVPTWSPAGEKTHAKGRLEGSILFANILLLLSWAFSAHWSCVDGRLPWVLLVGSSGHPFGISVLGCGERFLVTQTRVYLKGSVPWLENSGSLREKLLMKTCDTWRPYVLRNAKPSDGV